ncbi:MAG: DUF3784 domain-containing protein [Bacteroidaceae bacterium]|nr:DUF3784 domain-containing protein [Bacteroidaceae bacterium]
MLSIIFAILFVILAVVFLFGKGDMLIAGYNTASEEDRQKVNIRRLRLLMAIISLLAAVYCIVPIFIAADSRFRSWASYVFIAFIVIMLILANTWAKRK